MNSRSPFLLLALSICLTSQAITFAAEPVKKPELVKPTADQAAWQDLELGMFIHYGDFTFWSPQSKRAKVPFGEIVHPDAFDPSAEDTDQWMEAAKAFGAKYSVLTAKHGSGFCLWPTKSYPWFEYSVKGSKWKNGQGDVVREFTDSCRKAGIQPGIYCGVRANWHMNIKENARASGNPVDQAGYVKLCEKQLTEVWSGYGPLSEVWFDGGALPPDQGGPDLKSLITKLQPHAMVFGSSQATIRWVGNEDGMATYPCWATAATPEATGPGDPKGSYWRPAECDVPIRGRAWAWQPNEDHLVRTLDNLMALYYASVGRNCNLLLNLTPDRRGLIPEADMKRVKEFGAEIQRRFGKSVAETSGQGAEIELTLPAMAPAAGQGSRSDWIDHVILMEQITEGERVRKYVVEGLAGSQWKELCSGTCIGHKRIERFSPIEVSKIRFRALESIATPILRKLAVYQVGPFVPLGDHHWACNDGSGDKLKDSTGDMDGHIVAHPATAMTWGEGLQGKALDFHGGYVELPHRELYGQDFTFAAWVNPRGDVNRERILISRDRRSTNINTIYVWLAPGNAVHFYGRGSNNWFYIMTEKKLPADQWSHVAAVRQGRKLAIYINGQECAKAVLDDATVIQTPLAWRLGARWSPGGDAPESLFDGLMCDVQLLGRALSASEIAPSADLRKKAGIATN